MFLFPWILIVAGVLMVVYTKKVGDFTGEIEFAERHMGPGRTYSFIKLFGVVLIILSFLWIGGGLREFFYSLLGPAMW